LLSGFLSFEVSLQIFASGAARVDVPDAKYNAKLLRVGTSKKCGFLVRSMAASLVPNKIKSAVEKGFNKVANDEELKFVAASGIEDGLKKAKVFMNAPSKGPLNPKKNTSKFEVNFGILGYLSNAKERGERISIENPRRKHLNQMGLEWSFDAGIAAESKNIYNPTFKARISQARAPFPDWGLAPFKRSGKAVDFDAALMIRTGFLKSMFETLYQAGFFNLQVQDSLIDKALVEIDPNRWATALRVVLPDGTPLTKENYADSRLDLRIVAPPTLSVRNEKEFQLLIPEFFLALYAKAKGSQKEFEVVRFRAKFNLVTQVGMDDKGRLSFRFQNKPIQDFEILSRDGVDTKVGNEVLEEEMNAAMMGLLNQANIEIPFLKGKKVEIKSLGIDGAKGGDQALSIYLKIK
jgi:hypothetical protein